MILPAVFLLSLSSLAFEVLLARVFSISQWNHLSFMVISIALFGFAASGTFLSILDAKKKGWEKRFSSSDGVAIFIILYTITAITSFIVLNKIPLDYFRLPIEPFQAIYLLTSYLLLALPFFFTGLVISIAYIHLPDKTGFIYFASMTGSAIGAMMPVPLLPFLGEGKLIIIAAVLPMVLVPFGGSKRAKQVPLKNNLFCFRRIAFQVLSLGIALIAAAFIFAEKGSAVKVNPSPYKALSQVLQFPDTSITATVNSIRGRIDKIKSPYIRFAPGLSLKFKESLPRQWAAFRDGDNRFVFYSLPFREDAKFSMSTLAYSGYMLAANPEHVLLIQRGGGSGIPCAIASGAREITIVEQNPQIAQMVRQHYNLSVINENPRAYLAKSGKRFGIIHIENWGTSIPGSAALNQEFFFTKEAFTKYLTHLSKDGILIISRKLLLPPSDSVRLFATAFESLRSLGIENPQDHLGVLRNWDTFTLIASTQPLNTGIIKDFARNLNFDLVHMQGITKDMVNRFNIFNEPYHFLEIDRLAKAYRSGTEKEFFKTSLLDVTPQKDSRSFPARFLKWSRLKEIYKSTGSRIYSLLMSGEIVVVVVFFEAFVVAILLLVFPLFLIPGKGKKPPAFQITFFLAVGAGFMFVELFFIKSYTLLFGNPVISFFIVLAGVLVFSGAGGLWSQRVGRGYLKHTILVLVALLIIVFFSLDAIVHKIIGLPGPLRYLLALILLLPPGFVLGLPFPLGMRYLLKSPVERAYAWTANGCASVLTSILSAQIAISIGIPAIMACAVLAYFLAFLSVRRTY